MKKSLFNSLSEIPYFKFKLYSVPIRWVELIYSEASCVV